MKLNIATLVVVTVAWVFFAMQATRLPWTLTHIVGFVVAGPVFLSVRSGANPIRKSLQRAGESDHAGNNRNLFAHTQSDLCLWRVDDFRGYYLGGQAVALAYLCGSDSYADLSQPQRGTGFGGEIWRCLPGLQATNMVLIL